MTEEMRHHLELEVEDRIRSGMTPAEARRTALRDFGGVERWKEEARSARGLGGWDAVRQDLRYAVRTLVGSPSFTVVAVLTLGLGIGATTAVFSVVDGLLLEPLGYGSPDRIVRLLEYREGEQDGLGFGTISQANYFDWMAESSSLEVGALYDEYRPTLRLEDGAMKVTGASVGEDYFEVLGLRPQLGRFFLPEEGEGGSSRLVLSDGLWREAFGADPGVIGRVLDLNGYPYTVVGVARPFEDPGLSGLHGEPRLWRSPPSYFYTNGRGGRSFTAIARLANGARVAQAQAELSAIHARLAEEYPEANRGRVVQVVPLKADMVGGTASVLWILLGAVGLVLLVACANVANLLLFRAAGRGREIALRSALGASRGRIIRQLLVESLLLGLAGAAVGTAVAWAATRGILVLAAGQLPRLGGVALDPEVLGFALAAGLIATVVSGLIPALHTARPDAVEALKEGGRGSAGTGSRRQGRLRTAVVAAQVALAVVVMLGAGLLGRSLLRLRAEDPGLAAEGALVLRIDPPSDPFEPSTDEGYAATRVAPRPAPRAAAPRPRRRGRRDHRPAPALRVVQRQLLPDRRASGARGRPGAERRDPGRRLPLPGGPRDPRHPRARDRGVGRDRGRAADRGRERGARAAAVPGRRRHRPPAPGLRPRRGARRHRGRGGRREPVQPGRGAGGDDLRPPSHGAGLDAG